MANKEIVMAGTLELPHTCPKCNKTKAETTKELLDLFGLRQVPSGTTNQSWCKTCRANHS